MRFGSFCYCSIAKHTLTYTYSSLAPPDMTQQCWAKAAAADAAGHHPDPLLQDGGTLSPSFRECCLLRAHSWVLPQALPSAKGNFPSQGYMLSPPLHTHHPPNPRPRTALSCVGQLRAYKDLAPLIQFETPLQSHPSSRLSMGSSKAPAATKLQFNLLNPASIFPHESGSHFDDSLITFLHANLWLRVCFLGNPTSGTSYSHNMLGSPLFDSFTYAVPSALNKSATPNPDACWANHIGHWHHLQSKYYFLHLCCSSDGWFQMYPLLTCTSFHHSIYPRYCSCGHGCCPLDSNSSTIDRSPLRQPRA